MQSDHDRSLIKALRYVHPVKLRQPALYSYFDKYQLTFSGSDVEGREF